MPHDVIVIGAGPGGSSAAITAASLGLDVVLVDRGRRVGGSFVHTSALPNRVLREAALRARRADGGSDGDASWLANSQWLRSGIDPHLPPIEGMLAESGVRVVRGSASLRSPTQVCVSSEADETLIEADRIILAPGSQPRRPAEIPFDGAVICDSDSLMHMRSVPRSVTVIGGGFVGCELACTLAQLGSDVTLMDERRGILRMLDDEVSSQLHASLERLGIRVHLGARIRNMRRGRIGKDWHGIIDLDEGSEVRSDQIVVALGRQSNVGSLGLDRLNIDRDHRGWIKVDGSFRTNCPNIFAIGDAIGPPMLGGASAYQGRQVARFAAGYDVAPAANLPICAYTIPEIAMIGLTEQACHELGLDYCVGRADYSEIASGQIRGETEGMLKLVFERGDGRLLGVHIIGAEASELIHLGVAIANRGGTVNELADLPYSYPSLSQLYELAARRALKNATEQRKQSALEPFEVGANRR